MLLVRLLRLSSHFARLHSVASVVYALGFVLMTPQLFINYKLKSVAFLPVKSAPTSKCFVYRAGFHHERCLVSSCAVCYSG